jgi:D-alanyl-lipoteichoic acid acyltransferase DltB (MBOAT superfamily)
MFVSYSFILFLILLFIIYYIIPKKYQWILLLLANFIFYFSINIYYPIFIILTSLTIYITTLILEKYDNQLIEYQLKIKSKEIPKPSLKEKREYKKKINNKKKSWMLVCLLFNIAILAILKYTNFIIQNINNITHGNMSFVDLIVPLGISFYTFKAIGYLLDIYWNKCEIQKNFFKFTLFVSFFPQLIQGPISRYKDLFETLYEEHNFNIKQIYFGIERILWGYLKKLVIADRISIAVKALMEDPNYYTGGFVFIGMVFYAIQLYADFTGGIDIANGIAQTLGIHVEENFIRPYFSKNLKEYWRRWHITMGTWFRDYIFYPLSISKPLKKITMWTKEHFGRKAAKRVAVYIATMVTWFATGIWHGADWHYIVWGLANGMILLISEELEPLYERFHNRFPKLVKTTFYKAFQIIRTFLLLCCLRMFDTYASVTLTFKQFINMFTHFNINQFSTSELLGLGLNQADYIILLLGVLLMFTVSMKSRKQDIREIIIHKPYIIRYSVVVVLFFSILLLGNYGIGFDVQQFIYNQF